MSSACAEQPTVQPKSNTKSSRFNAANARTMSLKAWDLRRKRKAEQLIAELSKPKPEPPPTAISDEPKPDSFTLVTLSRVRDQMSLLADMMKKEKDPARLDRLAAAFGKLAEVERQLAGRPLPGSLRPTNRPSAGGMIEQPQTSTPGSSSAPPVQSEAQE